MSFFKGGIASSIEIHTLEMNQITFYYFSFLKTNGNLVFDTIHVQSNHINRASNWLIFEGKIFRGQNLTFNDNSYSFTSDKAHLIEFKCNNCEIRI